MALSYEQAVEQLKHIDVNDTVKLANLLNKIYVSTN